MNNLPLTTPRNLHHTKIQIANESFLRNIFTYDPMESIADGVNIIEECGLEAIINSTQII